jgi:hypothetical protein
MQRLTAAALALGVPLTGCSGAHTAASLLPASGLQFGDGGFHDVISGSNGAFTATPNYAYTTGLGSVDVDALNAVIGS